MKVGGFLGVIATVLTPFLAAGDALDQWLTRTSSVPVSLVSITYGKGRFVAVGSGDKFGEPRLITSSNGVDWVRYSSAAQFTPAAVTYASNGLFILVGRTDIYDGARVPGVCLSTNGTNWSFFANFGDIFTPTNIYAITFANSLFAAVGQFGTVATSADGTNWATHSTPTPYALTGVAYGNGVWVAVGPKDPPGGPLPGSDGPLLISVDGINWVQHDPAFNASRVLFARGMFVAIAGDTFQPNLSPMRYSFDGTNWMPIFEPSIHVMRNITYGSGGIFVSVGNGIIKTSVDSTNWIRRLPTPDVTNNLRAVAFGMNTFVAVGDGIFQSEDIRPHIRIAQETNAPLLFPEYHIYARGLSNVAYNVQLGSIPTNWYTRVTATATGGEDDFYRFSPSTNVFFRLRQVP